MKKRLRYMVVALLLCFGIGARADNVLTITGGNGAPDEEVTVSFALANSDAVTALQVNIPLDEELTLVSGSLVKSARLANHDASASANNGVLRVMVYSTQMATIAAGEGELFTLKLKMGSQPKNIELTPSTLTLTGSSGAVEATSQAGTMSIRCAKAQYSTMSVDYGEVPILSSYERTVTVTNIGNEPLEVTAVAALIQHNTSGIVSRAGDGIESPKGLEGKTYSTWESPIELAMIEHVMEQDG
jgi:hypothetical protein